MKFLSKNLIPYVGYFSEYGLCLYDKYDVNIYGYNDIRFINNFRILVQSWILNYMFRNVL